MNPLDLLRTVVALAVFPGVVYAGTAAAVAAWAGRLPRGRGGTRLEELAAAAGAVAGCGLLALPGSPLSAPTAGTSLAGILMAGAAGLAWGTSGSWPWQRLLAAAALLLPLLALAAATRSLDIRTIWTASDEGARALTAVAGLVALPVCLRPFDREASRPSRAALLALLSLLMISLAVVAPLSSVSAWAVAGICAAFLAVYGSLIGVLRRPIAAGGRALALMALVPAGVAILLALR